MTEKTDPEVRVVDRRWWARADADAAGGDDGYARKPTYVEDLERQLAEKTAQFQAYASEKRQSLDELEQVRVRVRRDAAREAERARRSVIAELLEVLDNLDRAISAASSTDSALLKGVQLVRDQFLVKLQGFGVTKTETLGHPFDAARHEAVSTTPVTDPAQEGLIVAVLKEGYAIGDDLLRPASVVVGKVGG